jgi:thiol-disulfide isomerase/thioredoxin
LIPPPPNRLADPEGEAETARLWRQQASQKDARPATISNAAKFLYFHDRNFARQVVEEARKNHPADAGLAVTSGTLDALTITGAAAVDTGGNPTKFDDARFDDAKSDDDPATSPAVEQAVKELQSTDNPDLLSGAANSIIRQFPALSALHHDFAYHVLEMAEGWIQRAVKQRSDGYFEDSFSTEYLKAANFIGDEAEKVRMIEKAAMHGRTPDWRVPALEYMVEFHFEHGEEVRAGQEAEEMLEKAPDLYSESTRRYALHIAQTVLGRIALREGRVAEARDRLISAGKLQGTDATVIDAVGPRWTLGGDLLARGETDAVLEYIAMIRPFWKSGKGRLDDWENSIRAGDRPDFAAKIEPARWLSGKPAPNFGLMNLQGRKVTLSSYKGKAVLLDFWATWCGPCRAELPLFEKLHRELAGKNIAILTVDVGEDAQTAGKYVDGEGYTFPVLLDERHEAEWLYRLNAFPALVVIDKKGRVVDFMVGARKEEELRAALDHARVRR